MPAEDVETIDALIKLRRWEEAVQTPALVPHFDVSQHGRQFVVELQVTIRGYVKPLVSGIGSASSVPEACLRALTALREDAERRAAVPHV
jgi:hypothetical protein